MITVEDMERLGLQKVLDILELESKEDLAIHMVDCDVITLEELAMQLSEDFCVCGRCGDEFANNGDGICYSCRHALMV